MSSIAVCSRSFSRHPVLRRELENQFQQVTFNDTGVSLSGENLIKFLSGHDRAIIALEVLDRETITQLRDIKIIAKYGVGLDKIDLKALSDAGIRFGWAGGVNRRAVSELALTMMLSLIRQLPEAQTEVNKGNWKQVKGRELTGKTIGIVGCGFVGSDLVSLLAPFNVQILIHDIIDKSALCTAEHVTQVPFSDLLQSSDIVSLHTPLDETTRGLIGAQEIAAMKEGAILLNTARGGLIDETALDRALASGQLSGAGLDVLATEPPEDMPLAAHPNVIITPHIGGSSDAAILAMGRAAIRSLSDHHDPLEFLPETN